MRMEFAQERRAARVLRTSAIAAARDWQKQSWRRCIRSMVAVWGPNSPSYCTRFPAGPSLAGDEPADGQAGGLQGYERDRGPEPGGVESGQADGLGQAAHRLPRGEAAGAVAAAFGQVREILFGQRVITAHRPLGGQAGLVS